MFQQSQDSWRNVFYICTAVYSFGTIFFLIFGTSELQTWAKPMEDNVDDDTGCAQISPSNNRDSKHIDDPEEFNMHIVRTDTK